ncbi:tetratricopeptide repeat protein [Photobacterium damselae]|uniref:tetratricopeptide repeat protein n=1 Tax=Photobacterium damselae TaxID=38293 RepID=UPI0030F49C75
MHKFIYIIFLSLLVLSGCSSSSLDNSQAREIMLKSTKNYPDLINFYKEKIKKQNLDLDKNKLAQVYLDYNDPESALFIVNNIPNHMNNVESLIIMANAFFDLGNNKEALNIAKKANVLEPNRGDIENLIAIIYASNGDIKNARDFFNMARLHLYDDIKIKNNLAVLDILDEDYTMASNKLIELYAKNRNDNEIYSNLVLALSKSNNIELLEKILKPKFNNDEINHKYDLLKSANISSSLLSK